MTSVEVKEYINQFIRPAQKRDLLDHFAGQAMVGFILGQSGYTFDDIVNYSYELASKMLQEREKRIWGQREEEKEKTQES